MTLLAVYPTKLARGVGAPTERETYDWRTPPASPTNRARVIAQGEVLPLGEAFARRWSTDAHFVTYVAHGPDGAALARQPRINKAGLAWVESLGFALRVYVLCADLDNPGHIPWSPAMVEGALEQARAVPALRDGIWYFTAGGRRLLHPLRTPLELALVEPTLAAWHDELEAQGLAVDRSCCDWTRMYRAPWVARADGKPQHQLVHLDGAVPRDPPAPSARPRQPARARAAVVGGVDFAASLPAEWTARARVLGAAVRAVASAWHPLDYTLGGALCQRGAPLSLVPALLGAVFAATGVADTRAADRVAAGRTTVRRFAAGEPFAGYDQLLVGWPDVAAALDQVLAERGAPARPDALPPAAGAALEIAEAIRTAPDGVRLVAAGCGTGKTQAAVAVAAERAARGRTPGGRAAAGARTVVSEPNNAMARQVAETARARGVPALRLFSPISERDAAGGLVCRYAESGRELAAGGLSVPWELCEGRGQDPCPHRSTCPAAGGREGPDDALLVVSNHKLLGALVRAAGKTGLRVIDEPPPLLETLGFTAVDFAAWAQHAHMFEDRFVFAVGRAVRSVGLALDELAPDGRALPVTDLVTDDVLEMVRELAAPANGPPVRWVHVRRAREQPGTAADIGRAARAAWTVYRALTSPARWVARLEVRRQVATLLLTGPNEDFVAALRAEGSTVVLDASPDVPVLSAAADYDLGGRVVTVQARDGAPVTRTLLHWSQGSRRALFDGGIQVGRFATALRAALAWAAEDPDCRSLGLITMKAFRVLLEHALRPDDAPARAEARKLGLSAATLADATAQLGAVAGAWSGALVLGHYGAVRGLDDWKGCDALVTIGDPWPNVGDVRNDAAYLALRDTEQRAAWLAAVELEQAHGRLRAPHRTRPGRALHVGRVLPGGPGWEHAERRRLAEGRPKNDAAATVEQLRAWIAREHKGSIRAAARALGCDDKAVRNYLRGDRAVPPAVAARVLGADESPNRDSLNRRFVRAQTPESPGSDAETDASTKDFRPHPDVGREEEVA